MSCLRRLALGLLGFVLAAPGRADGASLLEATGGVLGRKEVVGSGAQEARARAAVDEGAWLEAAQAWDEARRSGADPAVAGTWELVSLARAQEWELARLSALALLAQDPTDVERQLAFAWLMCSGGGERTARRVLRRVASGPESALPAAILELRSWRHQERKARVRRARQRALADLGSDAWLWLESSRGYLVAGDPRAVDDLERAVRAPGATGAHVAALVELRLALEDDSEALRAGLDGLERFPLSGHLGALTAAAALRPGGQAALARVLEADPDHAAANEVSGALALARDDADGALSHLLAAGRGGRSSPAVVGMLGRALAGTGNPGQAYAALRAGMDRFPDHVGLAEDRFELAVQLADPAVVLDAAEAWRRAEARQAEQVAPEVAEQALRAAQAADRPEAALDWAEAVLARRPDHPGALLARARALDALRRGADALAAYEQALDASPADGALLVAFATFLLDPTGEVLADPDRARALADRARLLPTPGAPAALAPEDAALLEQLRGWSSALR